MSSNIFIVNSGKKLDARDWLFHPVFLIICSSLFLNVLQIYLSTEEWSRFYIFNITPSYTVLLIQCLGVFSFIVGYYLTPKSAQCYTRVELSISRLRFTLGLLLFLNLVTFLIAQYYMEDANMYNLYVSGSVVAMDIEDKVQNSPFGIQTLSLLVAYTYILFYCFLKLFGYKSKLTLILNIILILKFISTGKLQSLLYFMSAILFCYSYKLKPSRLFVLATISIFLFLITRIIRNPDRNFSISLDFAFEFIAGAYFGSPIVNFTYAFDNGIQDWKYLFTHLLPAKLISTSDINVFFPDPTSPIGLFATIFVSFGVIGVLIFSFLFGWFTGLIYRNRSKIISFYIFMPFLIMATAFSALYNHYTNTAFFILPLLLSFFITSFCVNNKEYFLLNRREN